MEFLLNRYRNLTALLVVILAQLVLLAYQVKGNEDVRLIRVWAVTAVTPLARVLEVVRANTVGVVQNYLVLVNVRAENRSLQQDVGRLKLENQFLRSELQTAERAQALQAFQQRTPSRTLPARIIGTGTGANSRLVFVDRGSAAGVMRSMAVVTPEGIVGKVLAAYPTASQVLLISDPTFAAGVISEKSRVQGTLKGIGQSKVIVDHVQNEEKLEAGEMFYTSGDDRIFPKGMPVGRATVVRQGKTFKEIFVVPSGFQHGLEEVLIVVEGVHGTLPDLQAGPAQDVYVMPAPNAPNRAEPARPAIAASQNAGQPTASAAAPNVPPVLTTEADRIRDRYRRVGEAQGHNYGEPSGRIPNFNLSPDAARPAPGASPKQGPGTPVQPTGTPAVRTPPLTAPAKARIDSPAETNAVTPVPDRSRTASPNPALQR